jgi:hypothetical protein
MAEVHAIKQTIFNKMSMEITLNVIVFSLFSHSLSAEPQWLPFSTQIVFESSVGKF